MHDLYSADPPRVAYGLSGRRLRWVLVLGSALAWLPASAQAQDAAIRSDSARTAFAEGRHYDAARLLAALTSDFPTDPGLHWLRAQVLRALGAPDDARSAYRRATELSPDDPWLRLEFGRFLVEDGRSLEGTEVLDPVRRLGGLPAAASEAETLTGLASYWDGDLSRAELHLRRALDLDPARSEASAALRDVRDLRATTLSSATAFSDDDQPFRRISQVGATSVALGGRARGNLKVSAERRAAGGTAADPSEVSLAAMAGVALALPGGKMRINLEGGAIRRGGELGTEPVGAVEARLEVARETSLRVEAERTAYLWTVASLDTAIASSSLALLLDRAGAPAWAGEAGLRLERFPEGNVVRTVSAWFLAPVYRTEAAGIRVGYAGALRDSRTNTFRIADGVDAIGPPGEALPGVYAPYFTPEEVRTHSSIFEVRLGASSETSLRVTGVYAPWARELAPAIFRDGLGAPQSPLLSERAFHPWSVRAELRSPLAAPTRLSLTVEHARTAFYRVTRIEAGLTYRLLGK